MKDVIRLDPVTISELSVRQTGDSLSLMIFGHVWDPKARSAVWHILELERVRQYLNKFCEPE